MRSCDGIIIVYIADSELGTGCGGVQVIVCFFVGDHIVQVFHNKLMKLHHQQIVYIPQVLPQRAFSQCIRACIIFNNQF